MAKRANSEGTLYQRKDGRWAAGVTVLKDGAHQRVFKYAATQAEARKLLTSLKKNQDDGRPINFDRLSLRQWLDVWLDDFVKPNRSPRTYGEYYSVLRREVPETLGKLPLTQVRGEHLQRLFMTIASKGKGRTSEHLRAVLRASFNRAMKLQRIVTNPVAGTDPVQFKRKVAGTLTSQEAERLLVSAQTAGDRFEPLWTLLIALGLRSGEAFALKPEDVDLDNRRMDVQRSLARVKLPGQKEGHWIEKEPKTLGSCRSFRLPEIVIRAIVRQLAQREADLIRAGKTWENAPYLFTTPLGGPLYASTVLSALHAACELAEVPKVRIHDLRHTCGSFLAAQGVALPVLMDVLGHTQVVTAKRYIHTSEELRGTALDSVGKLLAPVPPRPKGDDSRADGTARPN